MMQLKVFIPSKILIDVSVDKVIAEDSKGSFCILPKHIDCVRILVPCILVYELSGSEKYIGIDRGVLVKCKTDIRVAIKNAIYDVELGQMKEKLETNLKQIDEDEKKVRTILTEIEVDFIKKYVETTKI